MQVWYGSEWTVRPAQEAAMTTTDQPAQRQYPGEGHAKCNPQRDATPPRFPNQADPPPQHPWPSTSDEGNSVPPPRPPARREPTEATSDGDEENPVADE